jgi:hypothetical protein
MKKTEVAGREGFISPPSAFFHRLHGFSGWLRGRGLRQDEQDAQDERQTMLNEIESHPANPGHHVSTHLPFSPLSEG